jgi:hypothetical protein
MENFRTLSDSIHAFSCFSNPCNFHKILNFRHTMKDFLILDSLHRIHHKFITNMGKIEDIEEIL